MHNDANVIKQTEDDDETPGVDKAEEMSGVNDAEEISGVNDDTPEDESESDKIEVGEKRTERTYGGMNLRRQPRKEYNHKNYDNVFNITNKTQCDGIILLQFNLDNFKIIEDKFDEVDAEYMFLTKTLVV